LTEKAKIEIWMVLPQGNGCEDCLERLEDRVRGYRGIETAHVDREEEAIRLCVHYDPNQVSLDYVEALAVEEGANLEWRYRHESLAIDGLDCADCARTLEGAVKRLDGVLWVSVNFPTSTLTVEYDAERTDLSAIVARVRSLGYSVPLPAPRLEAVYEVEGLDCADCALNLEEALLRTPGVTSARVDFALARLRVATDDGDHARDALQAVAESMGYSLRGVEAALGEGESIPAGWRERLWRQRRDLTTVGSALLIAVAAGMSLLGLPEWAVAGAFVAAILVGGFYPARGGWAALRNAHSLDMNALMTIAAVGAIFVGEWAEGAVAMFLFSLGNTLEGYTMDRARNAIRGLMDLSPRRATLLHGDHEESVRVESLNVGDRLLVRPGERIPMDGVVLSGESTVNQAPITGESVPVEKSPGHEVFAGTVNGQGALTLRVSRLAADTTLARIIKMVEEAQAQKAPSQRFVDRFARVYTPLVIIIAAVVAILPPLVGSLTGAGSFGSLFSEWVYRALVLLVIACPCALVISTPVSIVSGIASAARSGVLIKGGAHLEALGTLQVMAFDKTGTLTQGQPQVVDVRCAVHDDGLPWTECAECRRMVADTAAIERFSEHPLARAVVSMAETQNLLSERPATAAVEAVTGRGVRGQVNGHAITVGTHSFVHETDPALAEGPLCRAIEAAQAASTTVMVVRDDCCGVRGYIGVADGLRPAVPKVMAELKDVGMKRTVLLTGDNEATAQAIAAAAGIGDVRAGLLPDQKVDAIEVLLDRYDSVAMVGDGVNDAPALARATVGIAMGAAGSDTALETADVALMADDLTKLPYAVKLGRRTRRIIGQNVVLSLAIKALFLGLAVGGIATLWMAVFADVGASLLVTLNGMRLLRKDVQEKVR
jgi:Cd2+/Zn2+-exporting ATPase